jgi:methylmalonyl-CoA mutase cobalamin-binding subunit
LLKLLKENELNVPVIVGGSVITEADGKKMRDMGIAAIFGPSSTDQEIFDTIDHIVPT